MAFLIYGANGYTAQLILQLIDNQSIHPILAGRTESKIKPIAEKYGLPYQVIDLSDKENLDKVLMQVDAVLHCAGPYIHTARPMIEACIRTQTHYLDITGEIDVFEMAHSYHDAAKKAGITLLPGAGFDVVPTDCMAAYLKQQLPDATHLSLAFAQKGGGVSHGTALTAIENLGQPGKIRKAGKITDVPPAHKTKVLDFGGNFKSYGVTIPWGDVSTAFHNTGIPNIEVYMGMKKQSAKWLQRQRFFSPILKLSFVKSYIKKQIDKRPAGPSEKSRKNSLSYIWGEVRNAKGETKSAYLITPNGYDLTAFMALKLTQKVLEGNFKVGFQTPALAYGADLVLEMPNTKRTDLI